MDNKKSNNKSISGSLNRRSVLKLATMAGLTTTGIAGGNVLGEQNGDTDAIGPKLIEENESAGFNFPYYLYSPADAREEPLLVEPVNSGACDDDFQEDLDAAERTVTGRVARQISDELRIPLIVPVFANPCEGVYWNRFIQSLDTETMRIDSGDFERIDLQLLRMIDDAQQRLESHGVTVPDDVMLNGFSASGNFVNNFATLHPDRVASVTAGAINGMATLPREEAAGYTTNYQIGIADLEALTGDAFDKETWREVPQFCYMGAEETSPTDDTLPYRDVWSEEQAQVARAVYGDDMQTERMVYSEAVYNQAEAQARFEVYDDVGHSYSDEIVGDIISFHRTHNEIDSLSFSQNPAGGMDSLIVDVFVSHDSDERLIVKAFVDGSDVTAESGRVVSDIGTEVTIELTEPIAVDDRLTIGVFAEGDERVSEAIISNETIVSGAAEFVTEPAPGDAEIDVSYALAADADNRARLSVVPDGSSNYWNRREGLTWVYPGESGTETWQLPTDNEGVPFESGDNVELWLIPSGNQTPERAIVIGTITVGDANSSDSGEQPEMSSCEEDLDHPEVSVGFNQPPTLGDDTVEIQYEIDESFEQRARVRLFPETGSGHWGEGLDFIDPGESGIGVYDIPDGVLTLGETVEVQAFPEDWSTLDDVIALECALVGGVQFSDIPVAGNSDITIEFSYPDSFTQNGMLELLIDDTVVDSVDDISPGTFDRPTFDVEPIPTDADVSVQLTTADGEQVHAATLSTWPAGHASINVVEEVVPFEQSLSIEYDLSSDHEIERFCTLRLYNPSTSSWGVLLEQVEPGDSGTTTVHISADEPGVPFVDDDELEIALTDWDDPYAIQPLARTSVTVGQPSEDDDDTDESDDDDSDLAQYNSGDDGTVDAVGLDNAFNDWQSGELDASDLDEVFEAWQTGASL